MPRHAAKTAEKLASRRDGVDIVEVMNEPFPPLRSESSSEWEAPGRVNLIGEHTDYNEGYVLPFAIDRRTRTRGNVRDDGLVTVRSTQTPERVAFPVTTRPGEVTGWAGYVAGMVWVWVEAGHHVPGVDLELTGDLPLGAGLASSAALECSVGTVLADLAGLGIDRPSIAQLAHRAENDYVGMPCGFMDQLTCIHAQPGMAMLIDTRTLSIEQIPLPLADQGLSLIVIDTHSRHALVAGSYADRRRQCEEAAAGLGVRALRDAGTDHLSRLADPMLRARARHVVTENERVLEAAALLRSGQVRRTGRLLTDSHSSLRDDFQVSCPELDLAVESSLDSGAYGARMIGGGFGGSVIALIGTEHVDRLIATVKSAFAAESLAAPSVYPVAPSSGARRLT
jgi:galactokinase